MQNERIATCPRPSLAAALAILLAVAGLRRPRPQTGTPAPDRGRCRPVGRRCSGAVNAIRGQGSCRCNTRQELNAAAEPRARDMSVRAARHFHPT